MGTLMQLSRVWRTVLILTAVSLIVDDAGAQVVSPFDAAVLGVGSEWTTQWSPLSPIAELPRTLLASEIRHSPILTAPQRRIGAFWTAGNPGAVSLDVGDRRTAFEVELNGTGGAYRRPLDAADEAHQLVSALSWGSLGPRGAGIARLIVDRGDLNGAFGDVLLPYTSEPYSVADTLGERRGRTGVIIEGAGGWRVGQWAMGVSLGYHQQETRTAESAVPVSSRSATPGFSLGTVWSPIGEHLQIGVFGRWRQTAEFMSVLSVAGATTVYRFGGYWDPVPINLVSNLHTQRFERDASAVGGTLSGEIGGLGWVLYGSRERLRSENFTTTVASATRDVWTASGWSGGAAMQLSLAARRLVVTAEARVRTLSGESMEPDIEGIPFAADEKRWDVHGEVHWSGSGWLGGATLGVVRAERSRFDGLAEVGSDIRTWRPWAALEVARRFGSVAIAVGGSIAEHNPTGSVPDPSGMGPIYQNWVAPELALDAGGARAFSGSMTIQWQARSTTGLWVRGEWGRTSAARSPVRVPFAPTGDRTGWKVALGVVMELAAPRDKAQRDT